jgi:hypothetical protein
MTKRLRHWTVRRECVPTPNGWQRFLSCLPASAELDPPQGIVRLTSQPTQASGVLFPVLSTSRFTYLVSCVHNVFARWERMCRRSTGHEVGKS